MNATKIEFVPEHVTGLSLQSPDWLRKFEGCSHLSDQEALNIIVTTAQLAEILLHTTGIPVQERHSQTISLPSNQDAA